MQNCKVCDLQFKAVWLFLWDIETATYDLCDAASRLQNLMELHIPHDMKGIAPAAYHWDILDLAIQ